MSTKVQCFYCGDQARFGFLGVIAGPSEGLFVCQIHIRRAIETIVPVNQATQIDVMRIPNE